jgi:vitamin B12 transporter
VYDDGAHRLSATAYHNKIKDLIVGTQGLMADSPINLNKVTIKGLSLAASHQAGAWQAGVTADIQSPRNDESDNLLIRRANQHATAYFNYSHDCWQWGTELIASGKRYEDSANTRTLGGYAVLNLTGQYNIDHDWTLQARLNNLLDKDYALASNGFPPSYPYIDYNTPRANLFVNIRYQPK